MCFLSFGLAGIGASLSPTHPQGVFVGIAPVTLILYRAPRFHFSDCCGLTALRNGIISRKGDTVMPMVEQKFDREKHVYRDQDLAELLRKAVQFFNGTPVMALPLGVKDAKVVLGRDAMDAVRDFNGLGVALLPNVDETRKSAVYALYCRGTILRHGEAEDVNDCSYSVPFYIGKSMQRSSSIFDTMSVCDQLNAISLAIPHDREVAIRCVADLGQADLNSLYVALKRIYRPVMNSQNRYS